MPERNAPCPCGSGRKTKKCCVAPAAPAPPYVCYFVSLGVDDMTQEELEEYNQQSYLFPLLNAAGQVRQFRLPADAASYVCRHHPGCPFLVKGARPEQMTNGQVDLSGVVRI